jgi:hypothetical protein
MEQLAVFEERVILTPADLRPEITSFDDILVKKLKEKLEGRCSRHGFVVPDSIELLSRSLGYAEKGRFTSDFIYYMKAQGKVYNPPDGLEVEGSVIRKNKMGLYVIVNDAIRIMIPRDLHIGSPEFDEIEMGDVIKIQLKKSRFQVNDTHILSIGQFISVVGRGASAPAPAIDELAPVEEAEAGEAEEEAEVEEDAEEKEEEEGKAKENE